MESSWLGTFKGAVLPELEDINKKVVEARTINELVNAFAIEKEFCIKMHDRYSRLSRNLEYQENNDHITRVNARYQLKPDLLESFTRDANNITKLGLWDEKRAMDEISRMGGLAPASQKLFRLCQNHVIKESNGDLDRLKNYGFVESGGIKFDNTKAYLEHRMNDNNINCYLKNSPIAEQLKNIHEQEKQMELEHKNKGMGMDMDMD